MGSGASTAIHSHIHCDGCNGPVVGINWLKRGQNFDFCDACYKKASKEEKANFVPLFEDFATTVTPDVIGLKNLDPRKHDCNATIARDPLGGRLATDDIMQRCSSEIVEGNGSIFQHLL